MSVCAFIKLEIIMRLDNLSLHMQGIDEIENTVYALENL